MMKFLARLANAIFPGGKGSDPAYSQHHTFADKALEREIAEYRHDRSQPLVSMLIDHFDTGGLEKVAFDLSQRLVERGVAVVILVVSKGGKMSQTAKEAGLPTFQFNGNLSDLNSAIDLLRPAVAISHHCYAGYDALRNADTKIVEIMQNIYHWQKGNQFFSDLRSQNWRTIACSAMVRDYGINELGLSPEKLVLIHNGMDSHGLDQVDLKSLLSERSRNSKTTFLMTSHIWANKCHLALITAFSAVHARFPDTRLLIDGSVGHADVGLRLTDRIAELKLQDCVELRNSGSRAELSKSYCQSHIYVLPSIVEGFSISCLEACHFAMPLILTDTGGASEVLSAGQSSHDFGILIAPPVTAANATPETIERIGRMDRPEHTERLQDAMIAMLEDRDEWLERGMGSVINRDRFSIDNTVDKYMGLLQQATDYTWPARPSTNHTPEN